MQSTKFYREKETKRYLGRFMFAHQYEPEGFGHGRDGSVYYFMTNNDTQWKFQYGIIKRYSDFFNLKNPEVPADIEETERVD
jgi:hypothetical protein